MTDSTGNNSNGSNAGAFILGGVVVALAVLAWVVFGGGFQADQPDISIEVPGVGAIEGEVKSE